MFRFSLQTNHHLQNHRQAAQRAQPPDDAPERADLWPAGDRPDAPRERHRRVSENQRHLPLAQNRKGVCHVVEWPNHQCHHQETDVVLSQNRIILMLFLFLERGNVLF